MGNVIQLQHHTGIKVGNIELSRDAKHQNLMIIGNKNTGKSTFLKNAVYEMLKQNEKVIFFSADGTPNFYSETQDTVLNIHDSACTQWRICSEWIEEQRGGGFFIGDDGKGNSQSALLLDAVLRKIASRGFGRHIYIVIDDLRLLPYMASLVPIYSVEETNISIWITTPNESLLGAIYGVKGLLTITAATKTVLATTASRITSQYLIEHYGNEFATVEYLPPGASILRIQHPDRVEIQDVTLFASTNHVVQRGMSC